MDDHNRDGGGGYRGSHMAPEKAATYDRSLVADPFDRYIASVEAQAVRAIARRLYPAGVPRYLDFACGTGRITSILEPLAAESYGLDVSDTMLAEARAKCPRTPFVLQGITREQLAIEPVDLVSAFRFLGNAEDDLREAVLRALAGLLRPGGHLIVNNHRNPLSARNLLLRLSGETIAEDLHYWKLKRLLREAGFRVVTACGIGAWVVRARLMRDPVLHSRFARIVEPISRLRPLAPFCPDSVIVARFDRRAARAQR